MLKLKDEKFYICLIIVFLLFCKTQSCTCPVGSKRTTEFSVNNNFQLEDILIEGKNYGKPVIIEEIAEDKLLIIKATFPLEKSLISMKDNCPMGFELLDSSDLQLFSSTNTNVNYDKLIEIGVQAGQSVYCKTKTYPEKTDGSDGQSWEYGAIEVSDSTKKTVTFKSKNTYFEKNGVVICKQKVAISINTGNYDLKIGKSYTLLVNEKNIKSLIWSFNGELVKTNNLKINTKSLTFENNNCKVLQIWALNAANQEGYTCSVLYFIDYFGSNGTNKKVENMSIEFISSKKDNEVLSTTGIYFNSPDVVNSPTSDGGAWIAYTDKTTKEIIVLKVDSDLKETSRFSIEKNSQILDILNTPFGFAIYAKSTEDNNYSFLAGYFSDGKNKFKRNIMNNGLNPTTDNEQVSFFDKNKKILFGLESMHKPHNGKLAYGRGRIALIFAHYNHFGMKDGKRDDHTGDSFYTFDMDGKNEDYAWSWATSHSLVQSILYDGRYFITASLGDAYPENIKLCYIKPNQYNSNVDGVRNKNVNLISKCKDVIPGKIPGNGNGGTCGTLGGIHKFGENISLVYSRKSCNITGPDGKASSDTTGNLGIVNLIYDDKDTIKEVNNKNIGNGNNIINIRSGKFGENIIILFSTTPTPAENTKLNNHFYSNSDIFEYMIVNNEGVIQNERKNFENSNEFLIPNSSDLRELKNGGIIWGIPDKTTKKLVIMRSSIPAFSDPYSHTYSGLNVSDDSSSSNTSISNNTSSNTNISNNTTNTNSTVIIDSNNTIINNGTLIDGIKNTSVEIEISEDDLKTETLVKYLDDKLMKLIVIFSIIAIFINQ